MVNYGCPKNEVDAESMAQVLLGTGYRAIADPREADVVVVNTCGFIRSAASESLSGIRSLVARKRPGQVVVAAGCLAERDGARLAKRVPGLDGVLGTLRWAEIARLVEEVRAGRPAYWLGPARAEPHVRRAALGPSAYLKISDGCDIGCAFCTIPQIKGPHRSKPADLIVAEARELVAQGVREVNLIGQHTTDYGRDLGQRDGLADLLHRLAAEVPDLPWIRLMYAYPGRLTPRLIEAIAGLPQVVKYVDVPLQHAHPDVLARMGRPRHDPRQLVAELRAAIPGLALRSAFIVGFPGETEEEFAALLGFLEESELDRVGVFKYSREEGTRAAVLPGQLPERVKDRRYARAMELQQRISLQRNRGFIGQTLPVLVEGEVAKAVGKSDPPGRSVGRSYRDAPEVDGLVYIRETVSVGEIVPVRVIEATEYDLVGEVERPSRPLA